MEGRPDLGSFSRLSLPSLTLAANFFTLHKAGASPAKVAIMLALISFGANPFICKHLITPRCQILSIFTRSSKCHNAKCYQYYKIALLLNFKMQNFLSNVSLSKEKHRSQYQERLISTHANFYCSVITPSQSGYEFFSLPSQNLAKKSVVAVKKREIMNKSKNI